MTSKEFPGKSSSFRKHIIVFKVFLNYDGNEIDTCLHALNSFFAPHVPKIWIYG